MDILSGMRLLSRVVEAGSFSEAGRLLGMAPSSVSRQVSALEDTLGTQLLNRTTRRLSLTEAGGLFHDRALRILADVEDATRVVSSLESAPRGTLKLNVPVGFGNYHVAPALPLFLARYPDLTVDLTLSDHFIDLIEEGVDVAVRIGALRDSSLVARRLADNRRMVYGSPDYLRRMGTPETPHDLTAHRCIAYRYRPGPQGWLFERDGIRLDITVTGPLTANNSESLHKMILGGSGLAMLPTWMAYSDVKSGLLVPLLGDWTMSPTSLESAIHVVYPESRHLSAKVRAFIDFMADHIGKPPYWER
ncbi:LysR family transcriptional regulator [Rhodospirillum rubrum]|uniref:Transcriptional regulator, LysR family n=1 Tax=Rhodospirillum rubrum (strain ATCC 11170 / ATH 1.1.1 / DSM 467 / LMG 4362 / NCIMB 8255 / S1) TaxID=269796 RepID=Q2RS38_RHORT|nr:LysR family transcriptional regulator [Rhodospirillum rubrum]ABC23057.1 transcriptional regulator, LysR family [Rhodospirillum rubrum ATCC 11170]AEO48786.1 LysR family transcriptional regulator [Rhodospirillum rubrum F11]MBK1665565.1 LysR family transcriptional regulator [Rhodospirillum rubrum]MBK1677676.1 LysR family transcriptional regulator [Rhodospirillum rubrum]MBK5954684.1 LysR family transcriptional regulator [Rhodospirillum rubrum]